MTDAHKANLKAERATAKAQCGGDQWCLHLLCDIQKTSAVHTKTFAMLDSAISGMINAAMALRKGPSMARFRRALAEEVQSRLQIFDGFPHRDAILYNRAVLRTLVRRSARSTVRKILLLLCPNGEWCSPLVQFSAFGPVAHVLKNPFVALHHVTLAVMAALTSSQPFAYPRTTFARFCSSYTSGALASVASVELDRLDDLNTGPMATTATPWRGSMQSIDGWDLPSSRAPPWDASCCSVKRCSRCGSTFNDHSHALEMRGSVSNGLVWPQPWKAEMDPLERIASPRLPRGWMTKASTTI